jgi:type VI protein secretion system component Hcp
MSKLYSLLVIVAIFLTSNRVLGQEFFLKVGEHTRDGSTNPSFRDYVEIEAAQFSVSTNIVLPVQGPMIEKAAFQDFVISKHSDKLSTFFLQSIAAGSPIEEVEIILAMGSRDPKSVRIVQKFEFKNVYITNIAGAGLADNGCALCGLAENISFTYGKIRVTNYQYNDRGNQSFTSFSYDLIENKPGF